MDSESIRDEKVKVLKAIPALESKNVIRGQFRGYLKEKGVAPDSTVETFAALKLEINSWRLAGRSILHSRREVPAGHFHRNGMQVAEAANSNIRGCSDFGLSPLPDQSRRGDRHGHDGDGSGRDDGRAVSRDDRKPAAEMIGSWQPTALDMDAYERVLGDAMAGDTTLFAREDYVEEAWRIVDPVLKETTPVYSYEPNTWGPHQVEQVTPLAVGKTRSLAAPDQLLPKRRREKIVPKTGTRNENRSLQG
jgi:glucose-6-phosphate 1-dehydrogenase